MEWWRWLALAGILLVVFVIAPAALVRAHLREQRAERERETLRHYRRVAMQAELYNLPRIEPAPRPAPKRTVDGGPEPSPRRPKRGRVSGPDLRLVHDSTKKAS